MKASLELELIGDGCVQLMNFAKNISNQVYPGMGEALIGKSKSKTWVAEITGLDKRFGLARKFVKFKKDYSRANSAGSRGVYAHYLLDSGKYYEVSHRSTWRSVDRYFIYVAPSGEISKVDKDRVVDWAKKNS